MEDILFAVSCLILLADIVKIFSTFLIEIALEYTFFSRSFYSRESLLEVEDAEGGFTEVSILQMERLVDYGNIRLGVQKEILGAEWRLEGVLVKEQVIEGIKSSSALLASVSMGF